MGWTRRGGTGLPLGLDSGTYVVWLTAEAGAETHTATGRMIVVRWSARRQAASETGWSSA